MGPLKSNSSYSFDRPETIRDRAKMNLAGHRDRRLSKNYFEPWYDMFFWPMEDRCIVLTFRFLAASWWKIHSHVFEFLFCGFRPFSVSVIPWVSSYGSIWRPLKFPRFVPYLHIGGAESFLLPGSWSLHDIFSKEVDLARNLFHKQRVYH